jgi:hypothetical protein
MNEKKTGKCLRQVEPHDNFSSVYWIFNKLGHMIPLWKGKNPIYFGVIKSKVKVTVTINIIFDNSNHVVKFGKDPIYRTKGIVRKPVWTPARLPYPITRLETGV